MQIETTVTIQGVVTTVTVTGSYEPGSADCFYRSNGDPGDQGDPDYFAIEFVTLADGTDIFHSLPEAEQKALSDTCCVAAEAACCVVAQGWQGEEAD